MSTEIKNTLFRFITMRAPELLSKESKLNGFIFHPDVENDLIKQDTTSFFKNELIEPKATTAEQLLALQVKSVEFHASDSYLSSKSKLENFVSIDFLTFSNNFSKIKKDSLENKLSNAIKEIEIPNKLDLPQLVILWDNLFYQILTQKDSSLRDTIMHVLIADHYISNSSIKPSIVIPISFFGSDEQKNILTAKSLRNIKKNSRQNFERLTKALQIHDDIDLISMAVSAKVQLQKIENEYRKEDFRRRNLAQKEFNLRVKEIYNSTPTIEERFENKVTGEVTVSKKYVNLNLPEFEYESLPEIDTKDLQKSLSIEVCTIFSSDKLLECETFAHVYNLIDTLIIETNKKVTYSSNIENKRVAIIAGVPITINPNQASRTGLDSSFPFLINSIFKKKGVAITADTNLGNNENSTAIGITTFSVDDYELNSLKITIDNLIKEDVVQNSSTFTITFDNGDTYDFGFTNANNLTITTSTSSNTTHIIINQFALPLPKAMDNYSHFTFSSTIQLTDGSNLVITEEININFQQETTPTLIHNYFSGIATYIPFSTGGYNSTNSLGYLDYAININGDSILSDNSLNNAQIQVKINLGSYIPVSTNLIITTLNDNVIANLSDMGATSDEFNNTLLNFSQPILNITNDISFNISGEIIMNDGSKLILPKTILSRRSSKDINLNGDGTAYFFNKSNSSNNTTTTAIFIPSKFGIKNLGVADYRKVEQSICCYEPGEVSHIENIMAREYKEKSTERSRVTDTTTTNSSESESEKLTDTTTANRNEMHSEVAQVLHEDTQLGLNSNVNQSWGTGGLSISGNFAHNTSQDDSTNQAVTFAQDITQRAMERVVSKLKTEIVTKVIESYKENNKHGFDNTKGDQNVSGVYRWVNKIYNNQIVNYGKRAMVEFMIPEPAQFHILASLKSDDTIGSSNLVPPLDPRTVAAGNNQITTYSDINKISNPLNYAYWTSQFGITITDLLPEKLSIGTTFSAGGEGGYEIHAGNEKLRIPPGYYTKNAKICWHLVPNNDAESFTATVGVGNLFFNNTAINNPNPYNPNPLNSVPLLNKYIDEIPVVWTSGNYVIIHIQVTVEMERLPEVYEKWKIETFNAIIAAYEDKLLAYNQAVEDAKNKAAATTIYNPLYYRQIERNALKKNIMHYLVDNNYLGQDYIEGTTLEQMRPKNNINFDVNASVMRFMEQAFEWDIMSYIFYPFYWGSDSRWKTAYNYQFDDALFTNFMQSGAARVVLTVRPGFEKAVNWYMATGQVWNGGQVPTASSELFLSIDQELKDVKPTPEGLPWKTLIPSDLTVIQSSTIGLEAQGLPCGCPDTVGGAVNLNDQIVPKNNLIGGTTHSEKEKLTINEGFLELSTDNDTPEVIAKISLEEIKNAIIG